MLRFAAPRAISKQAKRPTNAAPPLVLLAFVKPLGNYVANVYEGKATGLDGLLRPLERLMYRLCGVQPCDEMDWKVYGMAMLMFSGAGMVALYGLQRFQSLLPLNPHAFSAVDPALAFNNAASYVTNTNWQAYGGETTMSHLTNMLGMTVQNFVSAATGMAILIAMIRGFVRRNAETIGNFWVDLIRGTL
jgi:K+-transporting ATPase ATPase A chain